MTIFSKLDEHLKLFDGMVSRTGVSDRMPHSINEERELRSAIFRCAGCTDTGPCRDWLEKAEQGSSPPDFCRNADLFKRLTAVETTG